MPDPQTEIEVRSKPPRWQPGLSALGLVAIATALALALWFGQNERDAEPAYPAAEPGSTFVPKVTKTLDQWRAELTPEQFEVTRRKGTERPFTGAYWNHQEPGKYKCVGCGAELFSSQTKYDSACGWPSFFAASQPENLHTELDRSHGMLRTEVMCKNCGAHLGHLFDDGPQPSGRRYCMNSAALDFENENEAKASSGK